MSLLDPFCVCTLVLAHVKVENEDGMCLLVISVWGWGPKAPRLHAHVSRIRILQCGCVVHSLPYTLDSYA